ncbi:MAG: helix-turn-helix transcriptional regulator [Patescibacteria group bacterium]
MSDNKNPKQLERYFKGAANHHRIHILMLVAERGGITTEEISTALNSHFKTISVHTLKLVQAGLLNKKYVGRSVAHELSPYGKLFVRFMKSF